MDDDFDIDGVLGDAFKMAASDSEDSDASPTAAHDHGPRELEKVTSELNENKLLVSDYDQMTPSLSVHGGDHPPSGVQQPLFDDVGRGPGGVAGGVRESFTRIGGWRNSRSVGK